jgi:predicted NodU family carbamoyl transferase
LIHTGIGGCVVKSRRRAMTAEPQARFGIDKLNAGRSEIPAVTHVDYSARIQTVHVTPTRFIMLCLSAAAISRAAR